MKILVTGASGQLGHDVMLELARRGHEAVGCGSGEKWHGLLADSPVAAMPYVRLDLTDREKTARMVEAIAPEAVIHCAAWTAVDLAEQPENRERVRLVNEEAARNLALACKGQDSKLLYISTDYVFDGAGDSPWQPDGEAFGPLSVYGRTKLAGENAVREILDKWFIVRIAWVFGANGQNFVRTMLRLSEKYDTLRVVCDQIGTPTYTRDLAVLLADMAQSERYGCYHATNEGGWLSWYDFAREIFRQAGRPVQVIPVTTEEYGLSAAPRPKNSRLDKKKLEETGFRLLPPWQDALSRYLKEIGIL